jgi:hypoxanthine phosphoribosyltransferase
MDSGHLSSTILETARKFRIACLPMPLPGITVILLINNHISEFLLSLRPQSGNMKLKDLEFDTFIPEHEIQQKISAIANTINQDYAEKTPVFLPILNGSFMFSADLLKSVSVPCRVSFVKISSYVGTASSGQIKTLIGLDESLFNQHILIVEDIIDTGLTLQKIVEELEGLGTKSVEVVALLRKKPARDKNIFVKYTGFEIENEFVVGYGLDYDGLGRNLRDIYKTELENIRNTEA